VPADIASGAGDTQVLEQLLETYKNNQSTLKLGKRESLARSLARNAAVKPGAVLSTEDMANLTDQLFACSSPAISVSGKPVMLTFTLKELSEKFGY
jgi:DNA mismatch repair protein MutL